MLNDTEKLTQSILDCYQQLKAKNSNLVLEVMPKEESIYEWNHYPKGDVKDREHHCQYYYHTHPSKDEDRIPEHGHFHLFFHKEIFSDKDPKIAVSPKYIETKGEKDALTHIAAFAMNEYGYPTAIFTVNYWVVLGIWYPAEVIIRNLDKFLIKKDNSPYAITNRWLTSMVHLFKPQIAELLRLRDEVIDDFKKSHPNEDVYYNKKLEVTSVLKLVE